MSSEPSQHPHNVCLSGDLNDTLIVSLQKMTLEKDNSRKCLPLGENSHTKKLLTQRQQRLKWRIDLFVFVQILLKYLERFDSNLHAQVNKVVRDCANRKKLGDPAYRSLAVVINERLRQSVGEIHWAQIMRLQRQARFRSQKLQLMRKETLRKSRRNSN